MRHILVFLIHIYQRYLSRDQGSIPRYLGLSKPTCIFYPTCSEYAVLALLKYGTGKGVMLTARRILRCNPFNTPGHDPLP